MRKSMIAVLAILVLAAGSLTWMLGWMTDLIRPELDATAEWTRTYSDSLAPGTKVAATYVNGGYDRPVADPKSHGLFVRLTIHEDVWAKPGAAEAVGFSVARAAFERYGPDRPIEWVQTKLVKPDGSLGRELAFARDTSRTSIAPVPYRPGEKVAGAPPPTPAAGMAEGGNAPRPPSIR